MFKNLFTKIFKRKQYKESIKVMRVLLNEPKSDFCTNKVCFNNDEGNCNCCIMPFNPHKCPYRNTNKKFRLVG